VTVRLSRDAQKGLDEALEARNNLGLSLAQPLDDVLAALERSTGLRIFVVDLGSDGIAGAFQIYDGYPWAIINSNINNSPVERQRFTLAHEFGHYWMKHGATFDQQLDFTTKDPKEVQANFFAGAFLAPAKAIVQTLERLGVPEIDFDVLITLAVEFGMSAKAMRIRLETCDLIKPRLVAEFDARIEAKEHWGRPGALGLTPLTDSLVAARDDGGRVPGRMTARAIAAAEQGLFPEERLAELLRVKDTDAVGRLRERLASVAE